MFGRVLFDHRAASHALQSIDGAFEALSVGGTGGIQRAADLTGRAEYALFRVGSERVNLLHDVAETPLNLAAWAFEDAVKATDDLTRTNLVLQGRTHLAEGSFHVKTAIHELAAGARSERTQLHQLGIASGSSALATVGIVAGTAYVIGKAQE